MHHQPKYITNIAILMYLVIAILPVIYIMTDFLFKDGITLFIKEVGSLGELRHIKLFLKSVFISLGTTFLCMIIGVPFAFILAKTDVPYKKIFNCLYLIPLCIPAYMHAIVWIFTAGHKGLLNIGLIRIFNTESPIFNLYEPLGVCLVLTFSYFPFVVILAICGLNSISQKMEDTASLYHKPYEVFKKVTLPLIKPHLFSGAVFVFIFSLFNYGVPSLLRVQTYPVEIFAQFSAFYNEKAAITLSIPLMILAIILLYLQYKTLGTSSYVSLSSDFNQKENIRLGKYRILALGFVITILLLTVFLPVATLIYFSNSFESYKVAFASSGSEICTSIWVSMAAATLAVILAILLSERIEKSRSWYGKSLNFLTFIPFSFPAAIIGIALIIFWNRPLTQFIYTGSIIIIIAYTTRFIPFTIRAVHSNVKQVDQNLYDAADLYEPNWLKKVIKIKLPLLSQGIVAGWVITFIFCMNELGAILLVLPPGKGTVSLKIYTLMHYGAGKLVAALCVVVIGINLIFAIGANTIKKKRI